MFDLDGVLVDSEGLAWEAWRTVLGRYAVAVTDEDVARLTGRTEHETYDHFAAGGPLPPFAEFWDELAGVTFALFDERLSTYQDAVDTLETLVRRGHPIAVASSSPRERVDRSLFATGLDKLVSEVVAGDEVERGKPDPEIFEVAAARLGVEPHECIAVEDAPAGIEAALAAGMRVVAVERGSFERAALAGAHVIVPRLTPAPFLD